MHSDNSADDVIYEVIRRLQTRIKGVRVEPLHRQILRLVVVIDQCVLIVASVTSAPLHTHDGGMRMPGHVYLWNDSDVSSLGIL